jgi:hypothetical protein
VFGKCAQRARRRMPIQISRTRREDHRIRRQPAHSKAATGLDINAQGEIDALGDPIS